MRIQLIMQDIKNMRVMPDVQVRDLIGLLWRYSLNNPLAVSFQQPDGKWWNTNADHFYKNTGIDIRENFYSFGLVFNNRIDALEFEHGKDIVPMFSDKEWVKGSFDSVKERMEKMVVEKYGKGKQVQIMLIRQSGGRVTYTFNS